MPDAELKFRFTRFFRKILPAITLLLLIPVSDFLLAWTVGDLDNDTLPLLLKNKIRREYDRGRLILFGENIYYQNILPGQAIPSWLQSALPAQGTPGVLIYQANFNSTHPLTLISNNGQQAGTSISQRLKRLRQSRLDKINKPYRRQQIEQQFASGAAVVVDGDCYYCQDGVDINHQSVVSTFQSALHQHSGQEMSHALWTAPHPSSGQPFNFSPVAVAITQPEAPPASPESSYEDWPLLSEADSGFNTASPSLSTSDASSDISVTAPAASSSATTELTFLTEPQITAVPPVTLSTISDGIVQAPATLVPQIQSSMSPPVATHSPQRLRTGKIEKVHNFLAKAFILALLQQGYVVVFGHYVFIPDNVQNQSELQQFIGAGPDQSQNGYPYFIWTIIQHSSGGLAWMPLQVPSSLFNVFPLEGATPRTPNLKEGNLSKLLYSNPTAGLLVRHYFWSGHLTVFQGMLYIPPGLIVHWDTIYTLYQSALFYTHLGNSPPEDFVWIYQQTYQGQSFVALPFTAQLPAPLPLMVAPPLQTQLWFQATLPSAQVMPQQAPHPHSQVGSGSPGMSNQPHTLETHSPGVTQFKTKTGKRGRQKIRQDQKKSSPSGTRNPSPSAHASANASPAGINLDQFATSVIKKIMAQPGRMPRVVESSTGTINVQVNIQKNTFTPSPKEKKRTGGHQNGNNRVTKRRKSHTPLSSSPSLKAIEGSKASISDRALNTGLVTITKVIAGATLPLIVYASYEIINAAYFYLTARQGDDSLPSKTTENNQHEQTKVHHSDSSSLPIPTPAIPLPKADNREVLKADFTEPEMHLLIDDLYDTPAMMLNPVIADRQTEHSPGSYLDIVKKYRAREFQHNDKQLTYIPLIMEGLFNQLPIQRQRFLLVEMEPHILHVSRNNQLPALEAFHWLILMCGTPEQPTRLKCPVSAGKLIDSEEWRQSREAQLLYDSYLSMAIPPEKTKWIMVAGWPIVKRNELDRQPMLLPVVHNRKQLTLPRPKNRSGGRHWRLESIGMPGRDKGQQMHLLTSWLRWRELRQSDFLDLIQENPFYHALNYATVAIYAEKNKSYATLFNNHYIAPEQSLHNDLSEDDISFNCSQLHTENAIQICNELRSTATNPETVFYQFFLQEEIFRNGGLPHYRLIREAEDGGSYLTASANVIKTAVNALQPADEATLLFTADRTTRFDSLSLSNTRKVIKAYFHAMDKNPTPVPEQLRLHFSLLIAICGYGASQEVLNACYHNYFKVPLSIPLKTMMSYAMQYLKTGFPDKYPQHTGQSFRFLPLQIVYRNETGKLVTVFYALGQLVEDSKPSQLLISNLRHPYATVRLPTAPDIAKEEHEFSIVSPTGIQSLYLESHKDIGGSASITGAYDTGTYFTTHPPSGQVEARCIYQGVQVRHISDSEQISGPEITDETGQEIEEDWKIDYRETGNACQ